MPRATRRTAAALLCLAAALAVAAETKEQLTARLWPKGRIEAALAAVEKQKAAGLLSDAAYARRKTMLESRLAGTYEPTMLSATDPPLNFIQNGGFEDINRNSAPNRSRWLWWTGWSWGGDYENRWEDRPDYVHSGTYSARITCKGSPGRIGIMTPRLPIVPGATGYVFTVWAKGEGENQLFLNFESGARGTLRKRIGTEWELVTLNGQPDPGAETYGLYIYVTGKGTIWLDDAKLVPAGGDAEN
ncbi:MAG: hypothetical protein AMS14_11565 [Planctomycetes bacterium DG_20]|nr:MAG: hypothetical protein AMS14_11565 [Planctomycetes bacterium DG_20]